FYDSVLIGSEPAPFLLKFGKGGKDFFGRLWKAAFNYASAVNNHILKLALQYKTVKRALQY
ncbi:MAG TPA: hypothetical protein VFC21_07755, partial [Bryobacteraceae bacterium]|nr:hypothetical protein [Bryobacteraceae bacterium]